jgi:hypothetical protein
VRAVRHTNNADAWRTVAEALGGSLRLGCPGEQVVALAGGCLVLRPASGETPVTAIELGSDVDGDPSVVGPDGQTIARSVVARPSGASGAVTVCPLWMTADVPGAGAALQSAGLTVRLASDAGQWVDLLAPAGGLVAVHADVPPDPTAAHAVLAFETGDVEVLAQRFDRRGLRADVVDESYGRSLRIDDPDGGIELWVNETITDLYGYRRGEPG